MERNTRKRQFRMRNVIPNRTRAIRNANKSVRKQSRLRNIIPGVSLNKPSKVYWPNKYGAPLTTASNNGNANEELTENERVMFDGFKAALNNSRRPIIPSKINPTNALLSPKTARKLAEIMGQHNDPVNMKRAINSNINLNDKERKNLIEFTNFLFQD
jgi:hypothetical protein